MALQKTVKTFGLFSSTNVKGTDIADLFVKFPDVLVKIDCIQVLGNETNVVRIIIPGVKGKLNKGKARTLGIVSCLDNLANNIDDKADTDALVAVISSALKLASMQQKKNTIDGDLVATAYLGSGGFQQHQFIDIAPAIDVYSGDDKGIDTNYQIDAILSIGSIKGNKIINHQGYAISPTVKQGYILPVAEDLLRIMEATSGHYPATFPISMQDITPYGNEIYHLNHMLQPSVATENPVVGIAICTDSAITHGTATSREINVAAVVKFVLAVAREYGSGSCEFYDHKEFKLLNSLYGSMEKLQGEG